MSIDVSTRQSPGRSPPLGFTRLAGEDAVLQAALRLADRIAGEALWEGEVCTWSVLTSDEDDPTRRRGKFVPAGPALYNGSSGIALFLAEAYRISEEPRLRHAVLGALRGANQGAAKLAPNAVGLFDGRVGVAYAHWRVAQILKDEELLDRAGTIALAIAGHEHADSGLDVISGAAGAIPALLRMSVDDERLATIALRLANHLLIRARRGVRGWSWPGMAAVVRDLTGLAHGVSGFGLAMLEMWAASGDCTYLYAWDQACAYERDAFDSTAGNWPDYRDIELSRLIVRAPSPGLKEEVRNAKRWDRESAFMLAWCHGAPGIGLSRLRACQMLGDDEMCRQEAGIAVATTLAKLADARNYSLCHGGFGNCELVLVASRNWEREDLKSTVESFVAKSVDRFEGSLHWPCGTLDGIPDPSLMMGEAGIGYFLLRYANSATPSILCLENCEQPKKPDRSDPAYLAERQANVSIWFGRSANACGHILGRESDLLAAATDASRSDVWNAFVRVQAAIAAADPELRVALTDASAIERARYQAALEVLNQADTIRESILREPIGNDDWETREFRLREHVRVVATHLDWSSQGNGDSLPLVLAQPMLTIVYATGGSVFTRTITPFAGLVFEAIREGATSAEVCNYVACRLEAPSPESKESITSAVREQLLHAYANGLIELTVRSFCIRGQGGVVGQPADS